MRDKLRELLSPHFGHLDFLMKIHKEEISYEDMSLLVDLIKDRNIVAILHKDLHSYNSYYILMVELFFIKENMKYIKLFKSLTREPKDIFLNILKDSKKFSKIKDKVDEIVNDDELSESFKRWSSRIKNEEYAITYTNSIKNKDTLDGIFNSTETIVELKDYGSVIGYLPSSWCITNRSTFDQYLRGQRIFLLKINDDVYGVNTTLSLDRITYVTDKYNSMVNDSVINEIASEAITRFKLKPENSVAPSVGMKENIKVKIPIGSTIDRKKSIYKHIGDNCIKFFNRFRNWLSRFV